MSRLREIRKSRELKLRDVADVLGVTETAMSRYEREDNRLTLPLLRRLATALGCTVAEIVGEEAAAAFAADLLQIPEVDVRAGAGGGGLVQTHIEVINGQTVLADDVLSIWGLPEDYVRRDMRIRPGAAWMVEVLGDSMEPTLKSGDKVLVDTGNKVPSPSGLFVLDDGVGVIIKRLEVIQNTDPQAVIVKSDNPEADTREMTLDEITIIGRVMMRATRV